MQINITYDSSVAAAPAGFKTAVQAAVQFFDTTFSNNISININFGWGEVGGSTMAPSSVGESSAIYDTFYTYSQVKSALLAADANTPAMLTAVQSLPTVDPTGGATFALPTAEEKALGIFTGSATTVDGYVGLSSTAAFTFDPNNRAVAGEYDAIGVLEHEISEVLGRTVFTSQQINISQTAQPNIVTVNDALDLFRYTAAGVHTFQEGPAYFSLNNGVTNLKSFDDGNNGGDSGDWASSSQVDSFDAFGLSGVLQPVSVTDLQVMDLLGYESLITGTAANHYTANFEGVYRQYTLATGGASVTGGPEGISDTLANVQRVQFVDGYMAYSPTDTAGEVYRLYEAALGRAPDPEGLAGWANQVDSGVSLQSVANSFVTSTEFQNVYGSLTDTAFVTLLYHNVLHRAPDPGGLNGWLGALSQGVSRAQVLLGFSQSQEDINDLSPPVQQGLWVGNVYAAEVARLYDTTLSRLPDLQGLTGWTQALENGSTTLLQEVNGFMASAEFQQVYGNLTNSDFVTLLYNNALHRAPDPGGLTGWVNALNGGESRAQVVLSFSESAEHIADTAPHIDYGIWIA